MNNNYLKNGYGISQTLVLIRYRSYPVPPSPPNPLTVVQLFSTSVADPLRKQLGHTAQFDMYSFCLANKIFSSWVCSFC